VGVKVNPAKLTESALREAALSYLDRMDASVEQVRRVLKRRIFRHGDDSTRAEAHLAVERVLERLLEARLLDDARFARGFAESARRRGASALYLREKMRTRGLSPELIDEAIEATSNDEAHNEEASALIYARKRRLLERYDLTDAGQRNKALASLARRGFSFDIAKKVLGL
jgi:regulatory protein